MIEDLKKKFVTVTMVLILATMGILFLAFYHYTSYRTAASKRPIVKWFADNDILVNDDYMRQITAIEETGFNSIVGVIMNSKGDTVKIRAIGDGYSEDVTQRLLDRIMKNKPNGWREGSFVYAIRQLDEEHKLVVLLNTEQHENALYVFVIIVLILVGIGLLSFVTVDLSRFVTEPARQELEREKRFITDASHELKTPLGAISINAQALEMENGENIHVKNIVSETKRMNSLIERLLTLARLEEKAAGESREFSISAAVEEMSLTYESVAYEKDIDYSYDVMENVKGYGNEEEFKQLVAILLDNAIKHSGIKDEIRILLKKECGKVVFSVRNTGDVIAEEHLPYIFDRFYSCDRENNKASFGLGLSIAKAITESMNGSISVESGQEGTCFTVEL